MPRAPKPPTDDQPVPRISVLERRLQNPFGEPSSEIRWKRRDIIGHWINDDVKHGQVYRAKTLGWEPATPDMIEDIDSLGAHDLNPAGQITRGPRGQEVLMWMPTEDYQRIQMAKTRVNLERMRDTTSEQHAMLNSMAAKLGAESADNAAGAIRRYQTTTDLKERIERLPEGQ